MNIAALLAGDALAELGTRAATTVINNVVNKKSPFAGILNADLHGSNSGSELRIEELNLSKEEENELEKLREFAMSKGLSEIEITIEGSKFNLNVKENTLTAVIS